MKKDVAGSMPTAEPENVHHQFICFCRHDNGRKRSSEEPVCGRGACIACITVTTWLYRVKYNQMNSFLFFSFPSSDFF
ncbi:hypothetical protein PVAP13_4NG343400 [Panicum virgatum]|uniref:Uncharacterized protein n=1 Tax=Panicum virgatum TaxID=38727 RepID=A0A8T0TJ11_PANVG|nr:hypothetical protein PVAP13_4NG343400 [Panicum virgatum]